MLVGELARFGLLVLLVSFLPMAHCWPWSVTTKRQAKMPAPYGAAPLRRNWYLTLQADDDVVTEIERQQADCSRTMGFGFGVHGFGSVLHQYATALCCAMENNASLVVGPPGHFGVWDGAGTTVCPNSMAPGLTCFFGARVSPCWGVANTRNIPLPSPPPGDPMRVGLKWGDALLRQYQHWPSCPRWSTRNEVPFFVHALRWLFSSLSPRLVQVARQAAMEVYGADGAPPNLVTVHVRWGDKAQDHVVLQPISVYVDAVDTLVRAHLPGVPSRDVSVFVTTEDGAAVDAFRDAVRARQWKVYVYEAAILQNSKRQPGPNGSTAVLNVSPKTSAAKQGGWAGVHSVVSLLLALEAKLYVVTAVGMSSSNWGRIVDELRMAFVPDSFGVRV